MDPLWHILYTYFLRHMHHDLEFCIKLDKWLLRSHFVVIIIVVVLRGSWIRDWSCKNVWSLQYITRFLFFTVAYTFLCWNLMISPLFSPFPTISFVYFATSISKSTIETCHDRKPPSLGSYAGFGSSSHTHANEKWPTNGQTEETERRIAENANTFSIRGFSSQFR